MKVIASFAAFEKFKERAEQCGYRETLATVRVMSLYGSDGTQVAGVNAHSIKAPKRRAPKTRARLGL
jgi:hypothetical protein